MEQQALSSRLPVCGSSQKSDFLQAPFRLHAVAKHAVYQYSDWPPESSLSCVHAARCSIVVFIGDFGGVIMDCRPFSVSIWEQLLPLLLFHRLWILSGLLICNFMLYFQTDTSCKKPYSLGKKKSNLFCSFFWSFWLKGRVDVNINYVSSAGKGAGERSFVPRIA